MKRTGVTIRRVMIDSAAGAACDGAGALGAAISSNMYVSVETVARLGHAKWLLPNSLLRSCRYTLVVTARGNETLSDETSSS